MIKSWDKREKQETDSQKCIWNIGKEQHVKKLLSYRIECSNQEYLKTIEEMDLTEAKT